jgi:hypothetical protein
MRAPSVTLGAPATVVSALALVACGSPYPGGTLGQQVQSWARATGFSAAVSSLQADAARVRDVAGRGDVGGLRTVCDVLVTDALRANQNLPSPDGRLNTVLSDAYRAAAGAGDRCLHRAGSTRPLPPSVTDELDAAQSGYIKAQARIDLLGLPGEGPP